MKYAVECINEYAHAFVAYGKDLKDATIAARNILKSLYGEGWVIDSDEIQGHVTVTGPAVHYTYVLKSGEPEKPSMWLLSKCVAYLTAYDAYLQEVGHKQENTQWVFDLLMAWRKSYAEDAADFVYEAVTGIGWEPLSYDEAYELAFKYYAMRAREIVERADVTCKDFGCEAVDKYLDKV